MVQNSVVLYYKKNDIIKITTKRENQTKQNDEYGYYSFHMRSNDIFCFCVISELMLHGIEIPLLSTHHNL